MSVATDHTPRVTLIVGTRRGLFRVRGEGEQWSIAAPCIEGHEVLHVCAHPQHPDRLYAATNHVVWGAHIYASYDGGLQWSTLASAPQADNSAGGDALKAIWHLSWSPDGRTLYAGIDPAGLYASVDEGRSWTSVVALNQHSTRDAWEPSKGIFAVHSLCINPFASERMAAAISAGGVYCSEDAGSSWVPANQGVRAANLPQENPLVGHNVHRLIMHPTQPKRLYRQCYSGVYRSDDGGLSWVEITGDVPSDYGFAIAADSVDPDRVYRIPMSNSHMRATVGGRLRVYRSDDAGRHWLDASHGLPQQHAFVGVLREALATSPGGNAAGVFFGTSGGHLFASWDRGGHWNLVAGFLPPISSVLAVE